MNFFATPPLSVYIHLPWCEKKCPYCDFNSHQADSIDETRYIKTLQEDLLQDLPLIWGRQVSSLFIGGGTPSLFSPHAIHQLLSDLRASLNLNPAIEITMEANPGSADATHFKGYREAGVNRLSIGVQSFNNNSLKALGRVHDREQALSAYDMARRAGFDNINLDLMYALPGQDLRQARQDLTQALELEPEHISHYQLTIEPNTHFHHQLPAQLPDNDLCADMQYQSQQLLATRGYQHYEISAYAKQGFECRHNLNYWKFGDYVGIGAGAHGKITLPSEQQIVRRVRTRQPQTYMLQKPESRISQHIVVTDTDAIFEFMLNTLRLVGGFDKNLFTERCGLPYEVLQPAINQAVEKELLIDAGHILKPTALGLQFHNDLQAIFLDLDTHITRSIEPRINFMKGQE